MAFLLCFPLRCSSRRPCKNASALLLILFSLFSIPSKSNHLTKGKKSPRLFAPIKDIISAMISLNCLASSAFVTPPSSPYIVPLPRDHPHDVVERYISVGHGLNCTLVSPMHVSSTSFLMTLMVSSLRVSKTELRWWRCGGGCANARSRKRPPRWCSCTRGTFR